MIIVVEEAKQDTLHRSATLPPPAGRCTSVNWLSFRISVFKLRREETKKKVVIIDIDNN